MREKLSLFLALLQPHDLPHVPDFFREEFGVLYDILRLQNYNQQEAFTSIFESGNPTTIDMLKKHVSHKQLSDSALQVAMNDPASTIYLLRSIIKKTANKKDRADYMASSVESLIQGALYKIRSVDEVIKYKNELRAMAQDSRLPLKYRRFFRW